ncbi:MAG: extracellular solute-binding protein, partial [Thermoleophilia bacterium]|nr:extracellular solute-binding protein [Thermoleophilia bacterium]
MTSKIKKKGLVFLAGAALVALLLTGLLVAGCGDDGSSDANAGGTTATTAAATTTTAAAPATTTSAAPATTETTAASLSASLNGAGATFPEPLYVEWIGEFQAANPGVTINYQGIGSGGGIEQFTNLTVDFGASDAPMKDEEIAAAEAAGGANVLHIPTVFGAVAVAFNL